MDMTVISTLCNSVEQLKASSCRSAGGAEQLKRISPIERILSFQHSVTTILPIQKRVSLSALFDAHY